MIELRFSLLAFKSVAFFRYWRFICYSVFLYPILSSIHYIATIYPPPPSTSTFDTPDHLYIKLKGLGLGRPTTYTGGRLYTQTIHHIEIREYYTSCINQREAISNYFLPFKVNLSLEYN